MPKFLIIAATKPEVLILLDHYKIIAMDNEGIFVSPTGSDVTVFITGVGMVNTAFAMGKVAGHDYNHIINIGICGAFDRSLHQGEVVNVVRDTISEMGAENDMDFITYADMNLGGTNHYSSSYEIDSALLSSLKKVNGITVNKVHGNEDSIRKVQALYQPQVESMEGAAFLRGCAGHSCNYFQLRAVSNYVEKRNRSKWDIPAAIRSVNEFIIKLINELDS